VKVVAADLWVEPAKAEAVFAEAGVADRVEAVGAEAHALPLAPSSFDAVVSIDAFEYFGTSDHYLSYITDFIKPGGQLGIATPGMTREVRDMGAIPPHIKELVGWEGMAWHTAEWWRFHWEITELVKVTSARLQTGGWNDWLLWAQACLDHPAAEREAAERTIAMLEADRGDYLSFVLVTAIVTRTRTQNEPISPAGGEVLPHR
jgi:SAM-dependent methyltransferase